MDLIVSTKDEAFGKKLLDFLKEHEEELKEAPIYAKRFSVAAYSDAEIAEYIDAMLEENEDYPTVETYYSSDELIDLAMNDLDAFILDGQQDFGPDSIQDIVTSTFEQAESAAEAMDEAKQDMTNRDISPLRQAELLKALKKMDKPSRIQTYRGNDFQELASEDMGVAFQQVTKDLENLFIEAQQEFMQERFPNDSFSKAFDVPYLLTDIRHIAESYPAIHEELSTAAIVFGGAKDTKESLNEALYGCQTKSSMPVTDRLKTFMQELEACTKDKDLPLPRALEGLYDAFHSLQQEITPEFRKNHAELQFLGRAESVFKMAERNLPLFQGILAKKAAEKEAPVAASGMGKG